jgi:hypothetical protein
MKRSIIVTTLFAAVVAVGAVGVVFAGNSEVEKEIRAEVKEINTQKPNPNEKVKQNKASFNGKQYDVNFVIPSKYADLTKTQKESLVDNFLDATCAKPLSKKALAAGYKIGISITSIDGKLVGKDVLAGNDCK